MPYIHRGCGGVVPISFLKVKCKKCGKRWPKSVVFATKPPKDMYFAFEAPREKGQRQRTYSKPAQNIIYAVPGAKLIAEKLPNLPRWGRILVTLGIVTAIIFAIRAIRG